MPLTCIAVDWSGALRGARRKIWLAEAREGRLVRVECGRSREELIEHLAGEVRRAGELAVGLDFAFSMPEWFVREQGAACASELWPRVGERAETWLRDCEPPFWGRRGRCRPAPDDARSPFRRTEGEHTPVAGIRAKSVFQIGGAGAVGTGSLRGMPLLARLRAAGFAIWPFDPPHPPLVVEIYPRLLTGPIAKRSSVARELYLASRAHGVPRELRARAASSEDAFDAAVSALAMARHLAPQRLALSRHPSDAIEGRIWSCPVDPLASPSMAR
jgi:hypothetical protein